MSPHGPSYMIGIAARFGRIVTVYYSEQAAQSLSWAPKAGRRYAEGAAANGLHLAEKKGKTTESSAATETRRRARSNLSGKVGSTGLEGRNLARLISAGSLCEPYLDVVLLPFP